MEKIIDMYKACVENDNQPLLPPFEYDPENPTWSDFWARVYDISSDTIYQTYDREFARMYGDFKYYDFLEDEDQAMSDTITHFWTDIASILQKNQKRYQEMFRIYLATDEQIPFDYNYDLTETYGKTKNTFTKGSESDTIGQHQDTIGEITNTHNVAPFNSTNPQVESTDVTSSHTDTIGQHSDTYGQRIDTSEDDAHTVTKKGNIGVQTASDVAERFISMWSKYKYMELIFEDICKELLMIGD